MTGPVLELRAVRAREEGQPHTLALQPGELAVILVQDIQRMAAITELCSGLVPPVEGQVLFLGQDWAELSSEDADTLRGRLGATFLSGGWPPQLSVADSVVLPALHHGLGSRDELVARAADLCRRFGLPGLPLRSPAALTESELTRAALARAFLGRPDLLLLETPLRRDADPELPGLLVDAVVSGRPAACLWMTASLTNFNDRSIPAARRFRLGGSGLQEVA
ncbi:MAG: ATP-binding cassette domain-containing protein [Acetobacteraceae bacterium]|nr:ATP-binding cassette domain-containing protein [Acetobacteraceae bacterium]